MRRDQLAFAAFAICTGAMLFVSACANLGKALVNLPPQDIACVLDEADRGIEAERIILDCHLPADAIGFVSDLLSGQKRATAMKAARAHGAAKDASAE